MLRHLQSCRCFRKTDVGPTFSCSLPFFFHVVSSLKKIVWVEKWALLLNTVPFTNFGRCTSYSEMLSRLDAASVSERQSILLYVCRQPYCPVWGWGCPPAGPHSPNPEVLDVPYVGRNLFKSLSRHLIFFFHVFYAKKKKTKKLFELAEKFLVFRRVRIHGCCPSLSPRPGPLWHRTSCNCCFTKSSNVLIFFPQCCFFFSFYGIYLKKRP